MCNNFPENPCNTDSDLQKQICNNNRDDTEPVGQPVSVKRKMWNIGKRLKNGEWLLAAIYLGL
jgi:hypothetical protein